MNQQQIDRPQTVESAATLEAEARRAGFRPGFPPALCRQARFADMAAYRRAECPACGSRMAAMPFHRNGQEGGYRLILTCPVCGAGEIA